MSKDYLTPALDVVREQFLGVESYVLQAEVTMCATATLLLDMDGCIGIVLEGQASTNKTTVLDFFDDLTDLTHKLDEFTKASFLTNVKNVTEAEKSKIHLLPKLKDKVCIVPDLAPILAAKQGEIEDKLGMLTRVLDGHGLSRAAGTSELVKIQGDYRFTFLAATTPLNNKAYQAMSKLGNRLLFVDATQSNRTTEEIMLQIGDVRKQKKVCAKAVLEAIQGVIEERGLRETRESEVTEGEYKRTIIELAQISAAGRSWIDDDIRRIEDAMRLSTRLLSLAKARALLCGRTQLNHDDVALVARVALATMPYHKRRLFRALLQSESGELGAREVETVLEINRDTALKHMKGLAETGLAEETQKGLQTKIIKLPQKYHDILKSEAWVLSRTIEKNGITKVFQNISN